MVKVNIIPENPKSGFGFSGIKNSIQGCHGCPELSTGFT